MMLETSGELPEVLLAKTRQTKFQVNRLKPEKFLKCCRHTA